ncbi:MAG TPA: carboxy terminal-processing peptidase [Opitutaceae bacterium]|nr:carboxy terminal-processing peptidase [Opitutaceae bacterium]
MSPFPDSLRLLARRLALLGIPLLVALGAVRAADAPKADADTAAAIAHAPADRKFETSATLRTEAHYLIDMLEQLNFNRDAVRANDYSEVITDFMGELDGQRLFFLDSDRADFSTRYARNLYWNIKNLGNIDAGYDMFSVYLTRTEDRINWIFDELKKNIDLTTNEVYPVDRSKADWPANAAAADDLWRRRLKFELLSEVLNKKADAAKDAAAGKTSTATPAPAATPAAVASNAVDPKDVEDAKAAIHKRYERMLKNIGEYESGEIAEIFLSTVTRLYDPHSSYMSARSYEDFGIQMKLRLIGIGAMLSLEDDYCVVKELVAGGPAEMSKQLHPNDKIIAVTQPGAEPVEVIGMKLPKIVDMIRGAKDTQVRLTILPADAPDPSVRRDITLTRDVVKLASQQAHAAVFDVPDASGKTVPLGVITLPSFYNSNDSEEGEQSSASKDVAALLTRLQDAGVKGIVLDLRHNGGGLLSEAIDLTGLFIGKGPVVQVKDYQNQVSVDSDENPAIAYSGPLAVLVDRFSASASEIVTGALQNYGRAIVIGDSSTHGKGTVQQLIEMREWIAQLGRSPAKTGAAKLTIQKFYLPNGSSTQLKGVVPDIVLPSVDDYMPQLGEKSLDHALVWDEVKPSFFDGKPLEAKVLDPLRAASLQRQGSLEEFSYLQKNIDRFKALQDQKLISLNLDTRRKQQADDAAFRKDMKAEHDRLAKNDFTFREIRLGPPPAPRVKAPKKDGDDEADDDDSADENDSYAKVDIDLREALRVIDDAIALSKTPDFAANGHAPLTAMTSKKG